MATDEAARARPTTDTKVRVVLTAGAGGRTPDLDQERALEVADAFRRSGADCEVVTASGRGLAVALRAAVAADAHVVVIGGGDGSVGAAAAAAVDAGKPLGILPLGTFNNFAKTLGIPLELEEAVGVILQRHERLVDIGEVSGRLFVNNSSIGLYPQAVQYRREQQLKFGWPKWAAALHASVSVVRRFQTATVTLRVDGVVRHITTPFVFVGNNVYEMRLFAMGSRTRLDGGELSVYVSEVSDRFALMRLVLHALVGRLDQAREFTSFTTEAVEITAPRAVLLVSCDGEVMPMRPPLEYCIRPRALRVLAPADAR